MLLAALVADWLAMGPKIHGMLQYYKKAYAALLAMTTLAYKNKLRCFGYITFVLVDADQLLVHNEHSYGMVLPKCFHPQSEVRLVLLASVRKKN